jgi:hypothetical protein
LGESMAMTSGRASSSTLASLPRSAGARGTNGRTNGDNGAACTRALEDAGDGDTDAGTRDN